MAPVVKASIEIGHLLGKDLVGEEQHQALSKYRSLNLPQGYNCFLVDNYNFNLPSLTPLLEVFEGQQVVLDYLFYEKALVDKFLELLHLIPQENLQKEPSGEMYLVSQGHKVWLGNHLQNKYSCSSLTLTWYLGRMNIVNLGLPPAQEVINILPKKYEKNEARVKVMLRALFPEVMDRITWHFY